MRTVFRDARGNAESVVTPIDSCYDVVAPENVSFQFRVAGPFLRTFAWLLDIAVIAAWFLFSTTLLGLFLNYLRDELYLLNEILWQSLFGLFFMLNLMFCLWFWNALFEAFWRGRTLGKAVLGLRTLSVSGRPISVGQAFLRNILRTADCMLGPFLVLIMGSNDRMARLGDLAAGTIVVNERLQKNATPAVVFRETNIVTIESHIPSDFMVSERIHKALSLYIARRLDISPPRRYEIASAFAGALARKANFPYRVDPDAFLCALWQRVNGEADKGRPTFR